MTFVKVELQTELPDEITISWHFTDVQEVDGTLTDDEARQVLNLIKEKHDANIGINWETIDIWIDYCKDNGVI
jgi:hypothetical protein